jgi:sulfide dehydrogenase cytochrome subunit
LPSEADYIAFKPALTPACRGLADSFPSANLLDRALSGDVQIKKLSTTEIKAMKTSIRFLNVTLMIAAGLLLVQTGQAEELSRGAVLSASCEGCHGTYGRSPGAIPSIAGKSVEYLREALEGFRSGERQATVMDRHVKGYSEEDIRLISEYFSKQQ